MRDRLERTWHNDVFLAIASGFCAGVGCGIWIMGFALLGLLPWWVGLAAICASLGLLVSSLALLSRADRLRKIRWSKGDWR